MPALQIKDCPQEVYDRLKLCAQQEDRSLAQQALHIIKAFLATYAQPQVDVANTQAGMTREEAGRIQAREMLLNSVASRPQITAIPDDFKSVADMIRADRESALDCPSTNGVHL